LAFASKRARLNMPRMVGDKSRREPLGLSGVGVVYKWGALKKWI